MILTARLEIWLLGSRELHEAVSTPRALANLLVTGAFERPLVEERLAPEALSEAVSRALSRTAETEAEIRPGTDRSSDVGVRSRVGDALLVLAANITPWHHPLHPAVVVEFRMAQRSERELETPPELLAASRERLAALGRSLRELLPISRLELTTSRRPEAESLRLPEPPTEDDSHVFLGLAGATVSALEALDRAVVSVPAADDWGGGAFEADGTATDAGGQFGGAADDTAGGQF